MTTSRHLFLDGCSPISGLLGLIAVPAALQGQDIEYTTFYTTRDGQWGQMKFDFDARSLVQRRTDTHKAWWILGKRGEIAEVSGGQARFEALLEAGQPRRGHFNRLALVDGVMYACGHGRQVYRRDPERWVRMEDGLPAGDDVGASFEALAGHHARDLHAVGHEGEIWHFDGQTWQRGTTPTRAHLSEVVALTDGRYLVCGHAGTVLIGARDDWQSIPLDDAVDDDDLWGAAEFDGQLYVAGFDGVWVVAGDRLRAVQPPGLGALPSHRLRAEGAYLWSIRQDHVWRFDGRNWAEVVCPDNV